jgi:hypothetical protein
MRAPRMAGCGRRNCEARRFVSQMGQKGRGKSQKSSREGEKRRVGRTNRGFLTHWAEAPLRSAATSRKWLKCALLLGTCHGVDGAGSRTCKVMKTIGRGRNTLNHGFHRRQDAIRSYPCHPWSPCHLWLGQYCSATIRIAMPPKRGLLDRRGAPRKSGKSRRRCWKTGPISNFRARLPRFAKSSEKRRL